MTKVARRLAEAQDIAAQVVADLTPYCHTVDIAGSVRRGKADVGDLEIVARPRWELAGGLFGDISTNMLHLHLTNEPQYRWLKGNNPNGRYYQLMLDDSMQLDLFLADEDNYGLILLIRTGSSEFSASMLARWKRVQGIGPDQRGSVNGRLVTRDGVVIPTPTEAAVFAACRVPFIPPHERTGRVVG